MVTDQKKLTRYRDRIVELEREKRERARDIREILLEMKSAGLPKEEIAGVKLAALRHFEPPEHRELRESAEEIAAALGDLVDTPLGEAAVRAAA